MVRLPPGQYANLEGWDKQISSFMCTQVTGKVEKTPATSK
jgi:hypothetical protein